MTFVRRLVVALVVVGTVGAALPAAPASAAPATTWLCKPGLAANPCTPGLSTTTYDPHQQPTGTTRPKPVKHPKIDCFYVYPTVSDQPGPNADLSIDPVQQSIALYQAARYSQYCKVYAPMYRQLTVPAIQSPGGITEAAVALAYGDVQRAFEEYLDEHSHRRGFVLIGHSQGAGVLKQLVAKEIDTHPAVRKRLVSAILLGGNVTVRKGKDVGGDFRNVPACRKATQTGCVIAFSAYDQTPPADALFGTVGNGFGTTRGKHLQVLCTNPAALAGGRAKLDAIFPSAPFAPGSLIATAITILGVEQPEPQTVWAEFPDSYSGRCVSHRKSNVLMVSANDGAPVFSPSPTPAWGLHLVDANIALGDLVRLVRTEASAYAKAHH